MFGAMSFALRLGVSARGISVGVSGSAGDSLALFDEGGVTLLHVGML